MSAPEGPPTEFAQAPAAGAAGRRRGRRRGREQARSRVLRSALELSARAPFREVTVEAIAGAAGISRTAFYTHFRDKHELLLAALEGLAGELERMAEEWWAGEGPPAERVRRALGRLVSLYADRADLLRVVTEVSTYDDEVREAWLAVVERLIEAGADHVRAEQRAGLIPAAVDARETSEGLVWMTERCCSVHLPRGDRTPEELVAAQAPVWTAALYPGVIPADQLRPGGAEGGGPWGSPEPDWGTDAAS